MRRCAFAAAVVLYLSSLAAAAPVSFENDIAPIIERKCVACHGAKKAEGGYRMDTYARLTGEGDSGSLGFAAGSIDDSEAFRRLVSEDKAERMPQGDRPLPAQQIALFKRWIEEGTKFDGPDPQLALRRFIPPPKHPDPPQAYAAKLPVTALQFGPQGKELFVGGYHEITVWNPADGQLLRRIKNNGQRTFALRLSPDGKLLAAATGQPGRHGEVRLFEPQSGKLVRVFGAWSDVVWDCRFDPQGKRLALATADNTVHVYEVSSGRELLAIASHSDWVFAVAWNKDGSQLATGSRDKTAKVFDANSGELMVTYQGHESAVRGVAFSPDGQSAVSSSHDNRVEVWSLKEAKRTMSLDRFGSDAFRLETYGDLAIVGGADKTVRLFDLKGNKKLRQFDGHGDWVLSTTYSPAAKLVAGGGFDGIVKVFGSEDAKERASFVAAPGYDGSK